jgi:multiple sugar transport system substrate-binding protein
MQPAVRLARACLVTTAMLLAACSGTPADSRQVVRFWAMGYEGEVVAQMLPAFQRLHPDIRVELQQQPWTAAHEKLLTAFAGDSLPDVCALGNTWVPEFAALGALTPIDARVGVATDIQPPDWFAGPWATGVVDGKLYGLPWYTETRAPYVRRDLLAKAGITTLPRTWDEWRAAMAAIKAMVGPKRYAILIPLNEFEPLLNLAIQQPDPLLREGGRFGNFRSPGYKRTLAFYKEIFDKGWAPAVANTAISNVWDEFGNGYYSFYISGPWNIAEFDKRLPPSLQAKWSTMALPGPDGPGASVAGGTTLVLFSKARDPDAAWTLIRWLAQPAQQVRLHALTGDLPPRRSAWATLGADANAQVFRDQLERALPAPQVPEWERITTEMRLVAEQMVNGKLGVDEAAAETDRRADAILEKRRWMLDQHAQAPVAARTTPTPAASPVPASPPAPPATTAGAP